MKRRSDGIGQRVEKTREGGIGQHGTPITNCGVDQLIQSLIMYRTRRDDMSHYLSSQFEKREPCIMQLLTHCKLIYQCTDTRMMQPGMR